VIPGPHDAQLEEIRVNLSEWDQKEELPWQPRVAIQLCRDSKGGPQSCSLEYKFFTHSLMMPQIL
jgi:hypothetical protein